MSENTQGSSNSMCEAKKRSFPPCRFACPANVNVQAYVALISNGRFKESLELIRKEIPFPAVCGRVCFSPCEDACTRGTIDAPVGIRLLKRLVTELETDNEKATRAEPLPRTREDKIAVIGAGPAGLTAAFELVKMGYPVTVFERGSMLGGMLRECLPLYRLSDEVLDAEIKYIVDSGVVVKTNVSIGEDVAFDDLKKMGYGAIFIATGAPKCNLMNIEGEHLRGVFHALEFLKEARSGNKPRLNGRVLVVGGGNVAIDAARSAIRLGSSEVTVIYRRVKEDMRAHPKEIDEAEKEGIEFLFLSNPTRILGDAGRVEAVECIKTELVAMYDGGPRRPIAIPNSEFVVPADTIIIAIGESADLSFLPEGMGILRENIISVDPTTHETDMPGIFAGGDVATGPLSVIDAIASGKKAAKAIDLYLRGEDPKMLKKTKNEEATWVKEECPLERKTRQEAASLSVDERVGNFDEVELGYTDIQGITESIRCLHCGPCASCLVDEELCESDLAVIDEEKCSGCGTCMSSCPFKAIQKDLSGVPKVSEKLCKGCGICASNCPEMAISMRGLSDDLLLRAVAD